MHESISRPKLKIFQLSYGFYFCLLVTGRSLIFSDENFRDRAFASSPSETLLLSSNSLLDEKFALLYRPLTWLDSKINANGRRRSFNHARPKRIVPSRHILDMPLLLHPYNNSKIISRSEVETVSLRLEGYECRAKDIENK